MLRQFRSVWVCPPHLWLALVSSQVEQVAIAMVSASRGTATVAASTLVAGLMSGVMVGYAKINFGNALLIGSERINFIFMCVCNLSPKQSWEKSYS